MYILDVIDEKDKTSGVEKLIENSTPNHSFYIMVILAVAMATLGLLLDNTAIVIGSMLISPLLFSLLGVAMGLAMSNDKLITRSLHTFIKAIIFGIGISLATTFLFAKAGQELNPEIISRTISNLPLAAVAVIAGFAAAFSVVNPKLNESFTGIAISVALLPPVATIGIGLGLLNIHVVRGASLLLIINIVGILASSLMVFSIMNFHSKKKIADKTIKEEEKVLQKNIEQAKAPEAK